MLAAGREPGAEDALAGAPQLAPRAHVKRDQPRGYCGRLAASLHLRHDRVGQAIDAEETLIGHADRVVPERKLAVVAPQDLPRVPVERYDARAGGRVPVVEHAHRQLAIEDQRGGPGDQQILVDAHEAPALRLLLARSGRQRELRDGLASRRVETQAAALPDGVDAVGRGGEVAAERVRARLVRGVVVDRAEAGQIALPQHSPGVDVLRADAVGALDEEAPSDDLLRRTVAVARQDVHVRGAAEPQQAKRRPHGAVGRDDRVRRITVLVRP